MAGYGEHTSWKFCGKVEADLSARADLPSDGVYETIF